MFKALILQAQHNLSDARMEFMIRDRLSWMRFLGFDLGGPAPERTLSGCFGKTDRERDADSAYRSRKNEKWLDARMLTSRIHRRKPTDKPMPQATARANAKKSSIRARVEHVFAHQKNRFGLFIRTIGIARAEAK